MDLPAADNLLTQPTRARLFAALKKRRRAASTEELARELDLHVNGVRRQLELMEGGGLLERRRVSRGRGRPRDEWSIAAGASPAGGRPEAYSDLAGWLARAIPDTPTSLRRVERIGREIGLEIAPGPVEETGAHAGEDVAEGVKQAFTALGFQPTVEATGDGFRCCLGNCPYRRSARQSPDVVCTLHKGITIGLLEALDSGARLTAFEPRDPELAGCVVDVTG